MKQNWKTETQTDIFNTIAALTQYFEIEITSDEWINKY